MYISSKYFFLSMPTSPLKRHFLSSFLPPPLGRKGGTNGGKTHPWKHEITCLNYLCKQMLAIYYDCIINALFIISIFVANGMDFEYSWTILLDNNITYCSIFKWREQTVWSVTILVKSFIAKLEYLVLALFICGSI